MPYARASQLTLCIAPVEEWSDEESGDIPFTTAPEVKDEVKNENEEDGSDDSDEEGL